MTTKTSKSSKDLLKRKSKKPRQSMKPFGLTPISSRTWTCPVMIYYTFADSAARKKMRSKQKGKYTTGQRGRLGDKKKKTLLLVAQGRYKSLKARDDANGAGPAY